MKWNDMDLQIATRLTHRRPLLSYKRDIRLSVPKVFAVFDLLCSCRSPNRTVWSEGSLENTKSDSVSKWAPTNPENATHSFAVQHTVQSPTHLKRCHHSPSMRYRNTAPRPVSRVLCTTVSNHTIWNLWSNHSDYMSTPVHHRSMPTAGILVSITASGRYLGWGNLDRALLLLVEPIPKIKQHQCRCHCSTTDEIRHSDLNFTALMPHTTVVLPNLTIDEPSAVPIDFTLMRIGRNASNSRPSGRILCAK